MAENLESRFHRFNTVVSPNDNVGENCMVGARGREYVTFDGLLVARSHSSILNRHLSEVKVDFPRLIKFLLDSDAKPDPVRDNGTTTRGAKQRCMRMDLGCAGLNFQPNPDGRDPLGRCAPATTLCGKTFFEKDKELGKAVRADLGQLTDAWSKTNDELQQGNKQLFPHQPFPDAYRHSRYGINLRKYLFAKHTRCEWVTIQLKSLNRGDITKGHYDTQNCGLPGYNITGAICFIFMDSCGEFWSLKILVNSRKPIGNHLYPGFPNLYAGMMRQIDAINCRYAHLINIEYKGEFPVGLAPLTARTYRSMFLNSGMPWKLINLRAKSDKRRPVNVYAFSVISAIQRDLSLSMIVSALKRVQSHHNLSDHKLLELAIAASYQNSYLRFYYLLTEYQPKSFQEYYNKSIEVDKDRPYDDYFSDFDKRFSTLYWPHRTDIEKFNPTLTIQAESSPILLRCGVIEAYMAQNLESRFHRFNTVVAPDDNVGINCMVGARGSEYVTFDGLLVARSHSSILSRHLSAVMVDFPRLIKFLLGADAKPDSVRDNCPSAGCGPQRCMRIDLGCAGLNFQPNPDRTDPLGRCAPATSLCGKSFFEKDKELGKAVRADLGQLIDALSKTKDELQQKNKQLFPHQAFPDASRHSRYGINLRKYLFAKHTRCEWVTIQLKSLNRGDVTKGHYDTQNCGLPGYNITGALCFNFMDSYGECWSLKILVNSRKPIGNHLYPGFPNIYAGMMRQVDAINCRYAHLMDIQYKGEFPVGLAPLTARTYRSMFLNSGMPWKHINLRSKGDKGRPVKVYSFSVISAIQRDLSLSMIVSALKHVQSHHSLSEDKLLELAIAASYQNSYLRFYYLLTEYLPKNFQEYYTKSMEVFGAFFGGPEPRFSATGLDFGKVYMDGVYGQQRMDLAVSEFKKLFLWMNSRTFHEDRRHGRGRETTDIEGVHQRVKQTLDVFDNSPLVQGGMKLEIQEFRLLKVAQICALAGIHLKEHPILTKFIYIVKETGGHSLLLQGVDQYRHQNSDIGTENTGEGLLQRQVKGETGVTKGMGWTALGVRVWVRGVKLPSGMSLS
ncbi:hypothetical protein G9A89_003271 [Geosiphon pyriformis]|nr:hypothetical protein G9A89_003271 [Geosiphon pyriformis]